MSQEGSEKVKSEGVKKDCFLETGNWKLAADNCRHKEL